MIEYNKFRTGYTFFDIRQILKIESKKKYKKGEYMFITRATVLGRWREIKLKMYRDYEKFEQNDHTDKDTNKWNFSKNIYTNSDTELEDYEQGFLI